MFRRRLLASVAMMVALLIPGTVAAQSGTIAGTVRDTTGAVMPGVTVEASSPALIEKTRTAVTDTEGLYRIVELRPGSYTVTFTLTGFSTVRRDGIDLAGGVTANVSAEMRVGSLAETITVSGQAPLVDVQSATQHRAVSRTLLDDLPTGRQFGNYAVLIPGVVSNQQDVGGNESGRSGAANPNMAVHGSLAAEMPLVIEGMRYSNIFGVGGASSGPYFVNNGMVQEIAIDTSGAGADAEVPGVRANVIFKQGGNRFTSSWFGNFANDTMQANNLDDNLRARGAPTPLIDKRIWDANISLGGPIRQDRMWFYGSWRHYGLQEIPPAAFHDTNPTDPFFTPDLAREAILDSWNMNFNFRTTFQTSANSKGSVYGDYMPRCICANGLASTTAYEATTVFKSPTNSIVQGIWNWTITNRLLLELGETWKPDAWEFQRRPEIPENLPGILDEGLGITYRAYIGRSGQESNQYNGKAVLTYVTGAHNLRMGTQWFHGHRVGHENTNANHYYNFSNQVPIAVTLRTTPIHADENLRLNLGAYVQEQWTVSRLTLNMGLRYDHLNMYIQEQHIPASTFVGPRDFAEIPEIVKWHDVSPRLGAAVDLFGNGKTALKWNMGRFIEAQAANFLQVVNPMRATAGATGRRAWTDADGDFVPDCDLLNPARNGECEVLPSTFGRTILTTQYDPAAVKGWGTRGWNWELMGGIQHQLRGGLSVDVSYHRRWFGNFRVTDNLDLTSADFNPYCVTSPADARLPGGGGQQICGLFDVTPSKFGIQNRLVITSVEPFGQYERVFDGVDVVANLRLPGNVLLQGGTATGRSRTNECAVVDSPQQLRFCDVRPPMQTQVKVQSVFPTPWWGVQLSGTYQSLPGPEITASWAAPVAGVTGLGRPVSGGARTVTVPLVSPGTLYGDRLHQIDLRIAKNFTKGQRRIQPQIDLYNLLNANPVLSQINTYGARWQTPTRTLAGRWLKVGLQVDF